MPPEQEAAADSGALSLDQFVGILDKPPPKEEPEAEAEQVEAEPQAEQADPEAEAGDEEIEATEDDLDAEEVEEPEDETPKLPPPKSWAAEDHAAWEELTPGAQAVVAKREADRDRAVKEAAEKAGRATAEVKTLAEGYEQARASIADEVTRAATAWQEKWGKVDWLQVARDYSPQDYNYYKAQADAEREQIVTYAEHLKGVQAKAAKASELARAAFIADEATKLAELSPELTDPEKGPARRKEVAEYLLAQGFTADVLNDISAAELTIARKAQLWDNAQKAAKSQAALPRKNPISTAKPAPTGAGGGASPQRNLQAASQRLTKTGSIDAFVDVLNIEEEQRTRKARRT